MRIVETHGLCVSETHRPSVSTMGVTDVFIRTDGLCIIRMHRPFVVYRGMDCVFRRRTDRLLYIGGYIS